MVSWSFSLFADFVAAIYLLGLLFSKLDVFFRMILAWRKQQKALITALLFIQLSRIGDSHLVLIPLAGIIFGCGLVLWLKHWFIQEWLLVIFVLFSMVFEEFSVSTKETLLLEVLVFFSQLLAQLKVTPDLFESMTKVTPDLPIGIIQKRVHEVVFSRRSGIGIGMGMELFRGIDPFLDEFILTLKVTGWQGGATLPVVLSRLLSRAERKWDRTSRILLIKDRTRPYIRFGQVILITGVIVFLIGSPVLTLAWADRNILFLLILLFLVSGFLLYISLQHRWVRRFLMVFVFLAAYGLYAGMIHIHIPAWIGVQTISQILKVSLL